MLNKTKESASLSEHLINEGILQKDVLDRALQTSEKSGERLPVVLANLGLVSASDLANKLAQFYTIPTISENDFPNQVLALDDVNPTFLKNNHLLPLSISDDQLQVAVADPSDVKALEGLSFATSKMVMPVVASTVELDDAINRLYFGLGEEDQEPDYSLSEDADMERLLEIASDAPTIRFVDRLVAQAIAKKASDIHVEPLETGSRVRLRIDGVLIEVDPPARGMMDAVISRIKILANLDIAESRLPQDGRFKLDIEGREVDFRVSTTPTLYGESVVLRALERGNLPGDFVELGFSEDNAKTINTHLKKPDGIVLVTGPTGSGKTTTLYSALQILNIIERKILTVEDPIEYMLRGINQVQVEPKIGRTFASSLRSFLRQDPDVMMVGEIRDPETAKIAIQASLTGHLVLSTLHTNSAAGALTRLLDMGVDEYLIASTITMVVGQRLIRLQCCDCNGTGMISDNPCSLCGGSGLKGRTVIAEVLEVDDEIRSLIRVRADVQTIEACAIKSGMISMLAHGESKITAGLTNPSEVMRVTNKMD